MGEPILLSAEMILALALLGAAVFLFVTSLVRVDVAALAVLVALGLSAWLPWLEPLLSTEELFSGFSSNAVIAIIAVMIIGRGLDRTGIMGRLAALVLRHGGTEERRVMPLLGAAAALISAFMQNVGVAALFLPVVDRISARSGIPAARLLMPVGFLIILGGTATMIGASPLILLNDLVLASNRGLPSEARIEPFGLFAVLPVGVALAVAGLLYFVLLGRFLLPRGGESARLSARAADYFERVYGIRGELHEVQVTDDSPQVGMTIRHIEDTWEETPFMLALYSGDVVKIPPDREETVWVNTRLGLLGERARVEAFCAANGWRLRGEPDRFAAVLDSQHSGIAEIVVPPGSSLIGRAVGEIKPRRNFGTNILQIYRAEQVIRRHFGDVRLQAGDTLVVHASWKDLARLKRNRDVVVATDVRYEDVRTWKVTPALGCFALALALFLLTDTLSISLLAGALGMILTGVLTAEEAYGAVSLPTVFLLASLIPLGIAVEHSGAAAWITQEALALVGEVPNWVMQLLVALLTTFFTLVMSNVGATVLLVPLAINVATAIGADPALFALTVGVSASNAFLLPTNQVNALLMGPGGYTVADFMRVGGGMTLLYLAVSLPVLDLFY